MANERVTLKDIYDVSNRIEDKMDRLESRVSDLEVWRAELKGKIAIVVIVISVGFTLLIDTVKDKVLK